MFGAQTDNVIDNEAPHYLRRDLEAAPLPQLDEVFDVESSLHDILHEDNDMESNVSHPVDRANSIDSWIQMGPDFLGGSGFKTDRLGSSNALARGGTRYAIGSATFGQDSMHGRVQVFDENLGVYDRQVGKDIIVPGQLGLGRSGMAMSEDGTRLVVGGWTCVAMFEFDVDTQDWVPLGTNPVIKGPDGYGIAMSKDGSRIAASYAVTGKVWIYDYICDEILCSWVEIGFLNGVYEKENFGVDLAMSDDGAFLLVGSSYILNQDRKPGLVRLFELKDSSWQQIGGDILGEPGMQMFGNKVSMDSNGKRIAVASSTGVRVYNISQSHQFELETEISCTSPLNGYYNTDMSKDGNRIIANCSHDIVVYDKNMYNSAWEHVESIPSSSAWTLALSSNGLVAGLGTMSYSSYTGIASVWRSKLPRCSDSPLQLQLDTAGGSNIPYDCKWMSRNKGGYVCSENGVLSSHCPSACGQCSVSSRCADSQGTFILNSKGGKAKDCAWLDDGGDKRINKQCSRPSIAKTCRATCNVCG